MLILVVGDEVERPKMSFSVKNKSSDESCDWLAVMPYRLILPVQGWWLRQHKRSWKQPRWRFLKNSSRDLAISSAGVAWHSTEDDFHQGTFYFQTEQCIVRIDGRSVSTSISASNLQVCVEFRVFSFRMFRCMLCSFLTTLLYVLWFVQLGMFCYIWFRDLSAFKMFSTLIQCLSCSLIICRISKNVFEPNWYFQYNVRSSILDHIVSESFSIRIHHMNWSSSLSRQYGTYLLKKFLKRKYSIGSSWNTSKTDIMITLTELMNFVAAPDPSWLMNNLFFIDEVNRFTWRLKIWRFWKLSEIKIHFWKHQLSWPKWYYLIIRFLRYSYEGWNDRLHTVIW